MLTRTLTLLPLLIAVLAPLPAAASFHAWDITEVYSNSDGSVQFIEFETNANGQHLLINHDLISDANTYTFPSNLRVAARLANSFSSPRQTFPAPE